MEDQRRTTDFMEWGGDELEFLVEQLEGMHHWGPALKRHSSPSDAQRALMQDTLDSYWTWWKETLFEAAEALVAVRRREMEKAEVVRQEIGLVLGLVATEG